MAGDAWSEGRLLKLEVPRGTVTIRLDDSREAQELVSQLPLGLEWKDYGGNEKIAYPPRRLSVGAPAPYAGRRGDLCYYAPWGNLAFFVAPGDGAGAPGLVRLGTVVSGLEFLNEPGTWPATLTAESEGRK